MEQKSLGNKRFGTERMLTNIEMIMMLMMIVMMKTMMVNGDGQWKQRWSDQTSLSGHISAHAIRTGGPTIFDLPAFENPSRHFGSSFLHCVSDKHPNTTFVCILCNGRQCLYLELFCFQTRRLFLLNSICLAYSLNCFVLYFVLFLHCSFTWWAAGISSSPLSPRSDWKTATLTFARNGTDLFNLDRWLNRLQNFGTVLVGTTFLLCISEIYYFWDVL